MDSRLSVVCCSLDSNSIHSLTTYETTEETPADPNQIFTHEDAFFGTILRTKERKPGWTARIGKDTVSWYRQVEHPITPDNIENYLPGNNSALEWRECQVGSPDSHEVNSNVRNNTFWISADPKFKSDNDLKDTVSNIIRKLYPDPIVQIHLKGKKNVSESIKKLIVPYMLRKYKIWRDFLDSDSDSDSDDMFGRDYDHSIIEEKWEPNTDAKLLYYSVGGFFREHSDSIVRDKFATTLIFIPTSMEGGDLRLKIAKDKVYDPDNLLIVDDEHVVLQVSKLKQPTLISFRVQIPHEVTEVTKGYRLCLKFNQCLPPNGRFFNNSIPRQSLTDLNSVIYKSVKTKLGLKRDKLQKKLDRITQKLKELDDNKDLKVVEYPRASKILTRIDDYQESSLVILETGPQEDSSDPSDLTQFNSGELDFIIKVFDKYPYSSIKFAHGVRDRVPFSSQILDQDQVENLMGNPGLGRIHINGLEPGIKMFYLADPYDISIGHRDHSYTRYNDEYYSGYDWVNLYVLCVQKHRF